MSDDDTPDDAELALRARVSKWTPAQVGKAVELAQTNPDIAHAVNVFHQVYTEQARQKSYDAAIRPVAFTPERKGILGFKSLLPNWLGGDTVNYEEVPQAQGESPEDYRVRAEQAYAQAYDQASSQGIPIIRMKHQREQEDITAHQVAGVIQNLGHAIPGLSGLKNAPEIPDILRPSKTLRDFAAEGDVAAEEAPDYQKVGLPLVGSLAMPGAGLIKGSSIAAKVANNPIVRGGAFGAAGAGLESLSHGKDIPEIGTDMLHGAGFGLGMGVLGGLGGKAASLVNEGSLKRDIANLKAAGGSTSLLKGFKFPGLVENALENKMPAATGPGGDVAANIRDPFMEQFIRERSGPAEKFDKAIRGYMSDYGGHEIIPQEYADRFTDTALKLKDVPGAPMGNLQRAAPQIFEPVNLQKGTLVPEHEVRHAIVQGYRVVSIPEAQAMGLHVDEPFIEREPGIGAADTVRSPPPTEPTGAPTSLDITSLPSSGRDTQVQTGPVRLDPSAFRVVLKPRPMTPEKLQLAEKFLFEDIEPGSESAKQLQPVLAGILESRDRFPSHPEYAPDSLTAEVQVDGPFGIGKQTKLLRGYSALHRLRSQEIEQLSHSAQRLGIPSNYESDPVAAKQAMMNSILQFHSAENPDKAAELLRVAQQLPGGKEALYSVPLAEKAEAMQRKASLAGNIPMGFLSFKPFFRAAAIHAEPITSKMPARIPAAAAALGAENSDKMQLEELARRLKEEASNRAARIPADARLIMDQVQNYVQR